MYVADSIEFDETERFQGRMRSRIRLDHSHVEDLEFDIGMRMDMRRG